MTYFLVEIPLNEADPRQLKRATNTLDAAQARLRKSGNASRSAGIIQHDSGLICLVEAATLDSVRRLVALALLPAGRIRELPGS
jgi:hypothetical protein